MEIEQLRKNYTAALRALVREYLQSEKDKGKKIEEVNPWKILEENRMSLSKTAADGTNYPFQSEGGTASLLVIEQELNDIYKDEYEKYGQENAIEKKVEDIVKKEATSVASDFIKDVKTDKSKLNKEPVLKVWLTMIDHYKPYLMLKVLRDNHVEKVVSREADELEQILNNAIDETIENAG